MNTSHPTPEDPAGRNDAAHPPEPDQASGTNATEPLARPARDEAPEENDRQSGGDRDETAGGGPHGPAGPSAPLPPPPAHPQDFFSWVRSRGIQRGQNRWVGGVSSGIAARMGIDPVIVRGIFIALTLFAGIGVLLYGLGWAFLPEPDGRIHVQEAGAGRWTGGMTGSLITTLLGFTGLGGGFWGGERGAGGFLWACFWLAVVALVVYLTVDKGRRDTPAAMYAGGPHVTTGYGAPDYRADMAASTTPYAAPPTGTYSSPYVASGTAPYQGPYEDGTYRTGAAGAPPRGPSGPVRPRPSGPGSPAVAITAGTALLVGGGLKLLDAASMINLGETPNAIVWASAAAVLGLGIVLAGARGRTSGTLGFLAVVALLVGAAFNIGHTTSRFDFQDVSWSPATVEEAMEGLDVTGAHGTVDLTDLDLTAPLASDVVVPLDVTASNLTVLIPHNVPVEINADMTMGNIQERGSDRGGISTRESSYNTGLPGSALVVTIDGTFSNVTIQEGN